ncbi:MAG: polymer-forming cytoskeletal protein [Betaproteobacteria bacterium]
MFNLKNRDRLADPKEVGKPALKPALYDPPGSLAKPIPGVPPRPTVQPYVPTRDGLAPSVPAARDERPHVPAPAPAAATAVATPAGHAGHTGETPGSKLFVGVNIKLKGVEISDCDLLVIEGFVEASVHSKVMQIAKPGTLTGTALVDVAEVHGEFTGELTARSKLVVSGSGRVSGTIRYGQLIVAEGGEVSGDVKPLDVAAKQTVPLPAPGHDARHLSPPPRGTGTD